MAFKFLRKRKNVKIILWIITILIIPGFFFWGVQIGGARTSQYAAVINREPITLREFYDRIWKIEEKYKEIFGENYAQIKDKLNVEENVLDSLIKEKLLLQEARRRRIRVFKNEIVEVFKSDPSFKNEKGQFDEEKYKKIIASYPDEELKKIEDEIKKEILIQKLKDQLLSETNIEVKDQEIEEYSKNLGDKNVDKENVRRLLLWQKREKYFEDWYKNLKKKSKIIVYVKLEKK
jgi:hypothetical protein